MTAGETDQGLIPRRGETAHPTGLRVRGYGGAPTRASDRAIARRAREPTSHDADRASANRTGVYLAVLQLVFTLGWTTYVIYLPKLAAKVGIAPAAVILILMLDQAIFTVTDTAMGIAADRIAPFVGRLGLFVGVLTALSCAAFVALPFVAGTGPGAQGWFIALIVIWAVTSSALRAPPLTLLGKHRAQPSIPFLSALAMLGYGACGRGVALSRRGAARPGRAAAVRDFRRGAAAHALALSRVERGLVQDSIAGRTRPRPAKPLGKMPIDLHRIDGDPVARLSTAFQHQQRAVLSALCQARPICNG